MQLPEPVDRVLAHALGLGHQSATPMGHALGLGLQGGGNQRVALEQVILRFTTPTGLCLPDSVDPCFQDSPPPQRPRPTDTATRPAATCRGLTATAAAAFDPQPTIPLMDWFSPCQKS